MLIAFVFAARIAGMLLFERSDARNHSFIVGETSIVGVVTIFTVCVIAGQYLFPQLRFDALVPSMILLHFFGKVACALAGCCYGTWTTIPVSIPSEWSLSPSKGSQIHPIQLEEAIVFFLLLILSLGGVMRQCAPGKLESLYFTGVGIERFLSTFLRGDLSYTQRITSQVFAAITFSIGIILFHNNPMNERMSKRKLRKG